MDFESRKRPALELVYRAKGLLRKAIEELETALSIKPDYAYAQRELAEARAQLN
ncbi:MAG: tetratricopeptide repeat protein [Candidatus Binatia bacterium]